MWGVGQISTLTLDLDGKVDEAIFQPGVVILLNFKSFVKFRRDLYWIGHGNTPP